MHDPVSPDVSFPELEDRILEWWSDADIPGRALRLREGGPVFVFYEGPPTANTLPPLHGVWPRAYKDIYTRYHTMQGAYVPRKAGWDCHGLPVEIEVEKRLGFTNKQQIVDYGIERFNALCRESVTEYVAEFVRFSERIAFWLDYHDPYHTMDDPYIESVWWSLAELHGRGLLYEADRVTPWCPRCETPLSDHEVAQGYQDVADPTVTISMPFEPGSVAGAVSLDGAGLAVWTTTPWTLIANLACAVGPDITYALAEIGPTRVVLARDLVTSVMGDDATVLATFPGSDLVGLRYQPPFDYAARAHDADAGARDAARENAWRILPADFVNVQEGTGVVHMAGAFGQDDLETVRDAGIPIFNPVDTRGRYDDRVPEFAGTFVRDADPAIIDRLRDAGLVLGSEPYEHAYPHCWRCGTPMLHYARRSWYIRTTAFVDRLLEVNSTVNWIPEHIRDGRYGNWLANNVDWSLSRYRFWGTPLPIWRCGRGHDTAVGSREHLSELAGRDLSGLDLHRPYVDDVSFQCQQCGDEAQRVPDLIDVWYDSGAMPFAQWGYPQTGRDEFERYFPADFIAEAIDQTRGWFYSLMAEGVMLFDQTAYRNVLCHGHLVDMAGKKMSSSGPNRMEPQEVFDKHGSDALRFFVFTGGGPGDSRRIGDELLDQVVRGPFLTLWNVYRLYVLYANIDGFDTGSWEWIAPHNRPALDRWALSELHTLIGEVTEGLESYDCTTAGRRIAEFIEDLSNWYVRRSRRRFWRSAADDEERVDKACAYWTLWTCLSELSTLMAPFTPFLAEELYRNLVRVPNPDATESVHLTDFPQIDAALIDPALALGMASARELTSLGRQARTEAGVKVRQPLGEATVIVPDDLVDAALPVLDLVAEELNVKSIAFADDASDLVRTTLRPNYREAGPAFGDRVRQLAQALDGLGDRTDAVAEALERGEDVEVELEAGSVRVGPDHVEVRREPASGTAFAYSAPFGVSLDLELTDELRREGLARELVHQLQLVRRDAGLDVTDRVRVRLGGPAPIADAVRAYGDYVAEEVLAEGGVAVGEIDGDGAREITVDGHAVRVAVTKA